MHTRSIFSPALIILAVTILTAGWALPPLVAAPSNASALQTEQGQLWDQIQGLKTSGGDIPSALYDRYFEIERTLNPTEPPPASRNSLDQGIDACPGLTIVQPESGDFVFTDYGETYLAHDDCHSCRGGRDLVYRLEMNHVARLLISTCGSGFDTYLCVYKDSCCTANAVPRFFNDDNPTVCGPHSLKAAINQCFLETGTYYIVLDGYNGAAAGHYAFSITSVADADCGPVPHFECPADYLVHHEGPDEAVCEQGMDVVCGNRVCGIIDGLGDLDVFRFTLTQCAVVTLSVYGNDTPGQSATGGGLNPIGRLFAGPGCDHPLFLNDDFNGTVPNPVGRDSRVVTTCLRPATYWFEVGGGTTTGPYQFAIDCIYCQAAGSLSGVTVDRGSGTENCVNWTATPGAGVYYVWRLLPGQSWVMVGNTPHPHFCESISNGSNAAYQVFTDPCGAPANN